MLRPPPLPTSPHPVWRRRCAPCWNARRRRSTTSPERRIARELRPNHPGARQHRSAGGGRAGAGHGSARGRGNPGVEGRLQRGPARDRGLLSRLPLHRGLWAAVREFSDTPEAEALDPLRRRNLDRMMHQFRSAGADLGDEARVRVEEIRVELSRLDGASRKTSSTPRRPSGCTFRRTSAPGSTGSRTPPSSWPATRPGQGPGRLAAHAGFPILRASAQVCPRPRVAS